MRHSNSGEDDRKRPAAFSMGVALAVVACVIGRAVNIAADVPVPPLVVLGASCGLLWLVGLTKWARPLGPCEGQQLAGTLTGLALSVGIAMTSQSWDLTPKMALPLPYAALSAASADVLYGEARSVRPIPVQPRPQSFLSHTHEQTVLLPGR